MRTAAMTKVAIAALIVVAVLGGRAVAAVPEDAYRRLNHDLVRHHVIPRYVRLRDATAAFDTAVKKFCAARNAGGLAAVRAGFNTAMDAWMGVQHLRFGPSELETRAQRLYFWPEARGRVAGAVRDLLAGGDANALTRERLPNASAAAQGLPAAEYLLYTDAKALVAADDGGARRCALLAAIARNVRGIAGAILRDWRGGAVDYAHVIDAPGAGNVYYDSPKAATGDLFKSLHLGLELIFDAKLIPVVGKKGAGGKPQLAESRASGRSLRNVILNLEALRALYMGEGGLGFSGVLKAHGPDPKMDPLMRKAFAATLATARSIGKPLDRAATDAAERPKVAKLLLQLRALKQITRTLVAEDLDLPLGFNALDGD
jgi:predicted lipoprotein